MCKLSLKAFSILACLFLCIPLAAQVRTGNLYGLVVDKEQNPLPGATITLTGSLTAPVTFISSNEGRFRFISLAPAKDYRVRVELQGFKPTVQENIIVAVGANVEIKLEMELGALSEEVTVVASTPVVNTRATTVSTIVTQEILQELPTARDPFVIIQLAPSVLMDRENVGSSESGQQAGFVSRGSIYQQNTWTMDGVNVSSAQSIGGAGTYFDYDTFEEMTVTTGSADITQQTAGIGVNMVTRRGGNKVSFGGRYYLTKSIWQADNLTDALRAEGISGVNKIRENKDYGFYLGLPILKDKVWFFGAFGIQDIQNLNIYGRREDSMLTTYAGKINLQLIPSNRIEIFTQGNNKYRYGRDPSAEVPDGRIQDSNYPYGTPTTKIQIEQTLGSNFYISFNYGFNDFDWNMMPVTDPDLEKIAKYDIARKLYVDSYQWYWKRQPQNQFLLQANYYNDSILGAGHEVKIGVESRRRSTYEESYYPGNILVSTNYNIPTVDFNGDKLPDIPTSSNFKRFSFRRGTYQDLGVNQIAAFFSDNISFGRFNVILGLRYDRQTPQSNPYTVYAVVKDSPTWKNNVTPGTVDRLDSLLPGINIEKRTAKASDGSDFNWTTWSPRLGLTMDLTGDGKTVAKFSLASYGDYMGTSYPSRWAPGGKSGFMDFWWMDNGDGVVDYKELYWHAIKTYAPYRVFDEAGNFIGNWTDAAGTFWGSFDYKDPLKLTDPYTLVDKDAGSSRTLEAMLSLEREIFPDFAAQINFVFQRSNNNIWALKYFPQTGVLDNQGWYISAGTPPASIPGLGDTKDAKNHEWYYTSTQGTDYSPYTLEKTMPDYYHDYYGLDLLVNKRLSNKWMLNASLTLQNQASHYGERGYNNRTNIWALEGKDYNPFQGYGGQIFSRWTFKAGGLYQLPFDINASFTVIGREGWVIDEQFTIVDYRLPNPKSNSAKLYMTPRSSVRLPAMWDLTIRIEKMVHVGEAGRVYIMADVFNVLNSAVALQRQAKMYGTYYIYPNSAQNKYVANPLSNKLDRVLNPRVMRLGIRYAF